MASSSRIHLDPSQKPAFYVQGIGADTANTASGLLQENHEKHHIFFNQSGFHNHIVHHLLTLYALNASPSELKKAYDNNASYQRPPVALEPSIVDDMHIPEQYNKYLGKEKYYHDFLVFFQSEIAKNGWENVLNEYVFKGDDRADDMLVRMFAGFLHPIIHLGFGVEFQQPAIIAEALAQAAVHGDWIGPLFFESEKEAKRNNLDRRPEKSVIQLLNEIRENENLKKAPQWEDGNKIRDGIMKRARDEMLEVGSQYLVLEENLEEKTAEMINAAAFYTGAAQHPPKQVKFDFFYMHSVNCSIFFTTFLAAPWLSTSNKIRLLEWKVRSDLTMYASRGSPPLYLSEILNYQSTQNSSWPELFKRIRMFEDDGHASKLVRALANGEKVCAKFEPRETDWSLESEREEGKWLVKGDVWRVLGNMVVDSVENGEPHWVRNAGMEKAWEHINDRDHGSGRL
ncbi:hypothetical protein P154DRAFT_547018 [Amniculicola lignicola CBS 123094]|uniref:HypA-like protein n=1 Tax=Amniculicola lignicola CBS 123094 TaxID=1392246 RepID=A0A6A5WBA0_9PLEO|nr:hypothetical protein P154DRAFT_547018 [Amniculicola lignicola CBS 123094]